MGGACAVCLARGSGAYVVVLRLSIETAAFSIENSTKKAATLIEIDSIDQNVVIHAGA